MLIFDKFPDKAAAAGFAHAVKVRFGREAAVFMSQDESDQVDPFPYLLTPPIVLVERDDIDGPDAKEPAVEALVESFGGQFAGT